MEGRREGGKEGRMLRMHGKGREGKKEGAVLRIKQGKILKMYQTMFSQKQTYKTKATIITIPGRVDIFSKALLRVKVNLNVDIVQGCYHGD